MIAVSKPNEHDVLSVGHEEVVATCKRSYATVDIAFCEDGLYRYSVDLSYSYGGFCGPIGLDDPGLPTKEAAVNAGMEELLQRWPRDCHSHPESVTRELTDMRKQIEDRLRQPSLF